MSKLGEWKLTGVGKVIAVSSGIVAVEVKDPMQVADFSLRYSWLEKAIKDNPRSSYYDMDKWSTVSLKKACKNNKLDKLGQLEKITRTVDLLTEEKRMYRRSPKTGRELLHSQFQSVPMDISIVMSKNDNEEDEEEI
jgi:hypothetical protein